MSGMKNSIRELEGSAALAAGAMFSAGFGLLTRYLGDAWSDTAQVVARYSVTMLLFWAAWYFGKRASASPKHRNIALAIGPVYLATGLFFTYGVQRTSIANVLFMFFAGSIVFSFLLGSWFLHESVTPQKIAAIVLAVAGIATYSHAILNVNVGVIAGLLGGLFDAISTVARKKIVYEDRSAMLAYQYTSGVAAMAVIMLLAGGPFVHHLTPVSFALTVLYGVGLFIVGYLFMAGFRRVDANIGTVLVSLEILFGPLLAWLVLGEVPARHELVGGLLIALAAIISGLKFKQDRQEDASATMSA